MQVYISLDLRWISRLHGGSGFEPYFGQPARSLFKKKKLDQIRKIRKFPKYPDLLILINIELK
mgnify:CR=1 FL=1